MQAKSKINIHHIGGRDGEIGRYPINVGRVDQFFYHIYDPDENCLPQIKSICDRRGLNFQLLKYLLNDKPGEVSFHINHCPCTNSLLAPNTFDAELYCSSELLGDYIYNHALDVHRIEQVDATTLDIVAQQENVEMDFISLDVQGAELQVLQGGTEQLSKNIVGVLAEVEFHETYKNQPLFSDLTSHLLQDDFYFIKFLEYPEFASHKRSPVGFRAEAMLMSQDALYLKKPEALERNSDDPFFSLMKLSYIALQFNLVEFALDALERAMRLPKPEMAIVPDYVKFLSICWGLYSKAYKIMVPKFNDLFTKEEALMRFSDQNIHPWHTFDNKRVLSQYFQNIDLNEFKGAITDLLSEEFNEFEIHLLEHGFNECAQKVKDTRLKDVFKLVRMLRLRRKNSDESYELAIEEELDRLSIQYQVN